MNMLPLVTVAIPTYNRSIYLAQCLASVLNQTYNNIEIIISDNNSTDNTLEIIKHFTDSRIKFIRQTKNIGMVGNWNECLRLATGEYFILLSDDDLMEEDAVEVLLESIRTSSKISFAYSKVMFINEHNKVMGYSQNAPSYESGSSFITNRLLSKRELLPSSLIQRTIDLKDQGGFHSIGTCTDLLAALLLAEKGDIVFIDKPLIRYRIHNGGLTKSHDEVIRSHEVLLEWSHENERLIEYHDLMKQYLYNFIYNIARSHSVRGDKTTVKALVIKLKELNDKRSLYELRLLGAFPVRWLANIRRRVKRLKYNS